MRGQIGQGSFGTVREAWDGTLHRKVAVKSLHKYSRANHRAAPVPHEHIIKKADLEGAVWNTLSPCEHVVDLIGLFEDDEQLYFVSELCEGGSLQAVLKDHTLDTMEICSILRCLGRAVDACHGHGIFYGDMKPANLLLSTPYAQEGVRAPESGSALLNIKLADFGCSSFVRRGVQLHGDQGTPLYRSPESFFHYYDNKADMWGVGVLLYHMVTGHYPFWPDSSSFKGMDHRALMSTIVTKEVIWDREEWTRHPPELMALAEQLLEKDAFDRIDARTMLQSDIVRHLVPA